MTPPAPGSGGRRPDDRTAEIPASASHALWGGATPAAERQRSGSSSSFVDDARVEQLGDRIGPYKLISVLGEGGFGVVYLAEQEQPVRRQVALKIIKLGMDSRSVVARFEAERQALALMDHPCIAKVFDAGVTSPSPSGGGGGGRPYFVMEYVRGDPISDYCDRSQLTIEQRLELFVQVCDAMQHAHQKGVIHRDIKPTNVLVSVESGEAAPKIIDFGIAKAIDRPLAAETAHTELGMMIGTPAYMSPEQAGLGGGTDIDTRSDIYSLGVLLYELLTGTLPFDPRQLQQAAVDEMRRIIREVEPHKPSTRLSDMISAASETSSRAAVNRHIEPRTLARRLRGDLDWIVIKALEKDRERRYASASDLAADVQRHLADEPVTAGPPSASYRINKFIRRNRWPVTAAVLVLLTLAVGFVATGVAYVEAVDARVAEQKERMRADQQRGEAMRQAELATAARAAERQQREQADLQRLEAERQAAIAMASRDFLVRDLLGAVNPEQALGREITVREIMDQAAVELGNGSLSDRPELEAAVRSMIGGVYHSMSQYDAASEHMEKALQLQRSLHSCDHVELASALNNLGDLRRSQARHAEAEQLYRAALAMRQRLQPPEHIDIARVQTNLAILFSDMDRAVEAAALLETAVASFRAAGEPARTELAQILAAQALVAQQRDDLAAAERIYSEALTIQRERLDADHPRLATTLNNLALVRHDLGRHDEAEAAMREVLAIVQKVHGPDHPSVATAMTNLAILLRERGKVAEAEPFYRSALEITRKSFPSNHPSVGVSVSNLGMLLRQMQRDDEAEAAFRESLAIFRAAYPGPHSGTATALNNLGVLLKDQRRFEESEKLQLEALEIRRAMLGPDHSEVGVSLQNLGVLMYAAKDYPRAEQYIRAALAVMRKARGEHAKYTLEVQDSLARVLELQGKHAEAEQLYRASLKSQQAQPAPDEMAMTSTKVNLASALIEIGRCDEAEHLIRGALAVRERLLPPDHWRLAMARSILGAALCCQGDFAAGEPMMLAAYEALARSPDATPTRLGELMGRIIRCYESVGRAEEAAAWRVRRDEATAEAKPKAGP